MQTSKRKGNQTDRSGEVLAVFAGRPLSFELLQLLHSQEQSLYKDRAAIVVTGLLVDMAKAELTSSVPSPCSVADLEEERSGLRVELRHQKDANQVRIGDNVSEHIRRRIKGD